MAYQIDRTCVLCGDCVPVCPVDAISETPIQYIIDLKLCTECDECLRVCPVDAIHPAVSSRTAGRPAEAD